ncbi:DNA-3-methyladenine glycosylase [Nocardioides caldifontis]|uniref:DNA-3-methyladenine glycosylase n=1 Tax=Nocardioides caldifontis TaxID=2588938 RepID=UPI0011DF887C|nr:DNA-3-methyladenine glycosylase [Nocardioides caldifontis]
MAGSADELARPALEVAPRLLGAVLRHRTEEGTVAVRLTEVEAYAGADDPGSHAHRGPTPRNSVMFGPAGHLYVYFTYGMHHCCNVVVGEDGVAAAVLLRAGEVVEGVELARSRRGRSTDRDLARGPARLCQALAIDLTHNGADLGSGELTLELGPAVAAAQVATGPRVGLRLAADNPWRFWLVDEPTVSAYRPAVVRKRGAMRQA